MWNITKKVITTCKTKKHLEILQGLTDKAQACGLNVNMIDANEVKRINPYLSDEVIVQAGVRPMVMQIL